MTSQREDRTVSSGGVAECPVPRPRRDPASSASRGRAARERVPLDSHAEWTPPEDRPDPVAVLAAQAASRLPELVPIRYGRMLVSPLTFLRGAAAVMAADLASTPTSGLVTHLCGDAHLSNFGAFASPERRLVFDINDFDETHPGPWEWDVKRLAASLAVAARDNGFGRKVRAAVVRSAVSRYRKAMAEFAAMGELAVWYAHADLDRLGPVLAAQLSKARRKRFARAQAKVRTRDSIQAFHKLTGTVHGHRRILADPPLVVPVQDLMPDADRFDLEEQIRGLLRHYRRSLPVDRQHLFDGFEFVDMARKVVGVGSVGTRCWIVLLRGRDDDDPLLLQVKEAQPSVLAPFVTDDGSLVRYHHDGQRVVTGQRLMQAVSDIFLGWQTADGFDGRRYTWIRDASFSVYALMRLGFVEEAMGFGQWLRQRVEERAGSAGGPLDIMYRVDGTSDLREELLPHWEGYRGSSPVRIGNDAAGQLQLDIYGEALDSVYFLDRHGQQLGHPGWQAVGELLDWLVDHWDCEEEGIWETRGGRKHFTYGRVMSWVAFDRAIRLATAHGRPADLARWVRERDAVYEQVMNRGWNPRRQAFVQHYDDDVLDASLLRMPTVGIVAPRDPRWLSTLRAMDSELVSDSLVYRYDPSASPDGLLGSEGTFSLCTFMYVDALGRAGRLDDARLVFEKMLTYANHLGLYAEEIAPTGAQVGNFPQAFTHLALIDAAITLNAELDRTGRGLAVPASAG